FNHMGDEYFVEDKEVTLPDGIDASQVVTFRVTDSNFAPFVKTLLGKVIPEILDQIEKTGLAEKLELAPEEIDIIRQDVASAMEDFDIQFAAVKDVLTIQKADYVMAINKDKLVPYSLLDLEL